MEALQLQCKQDQPREYKSNKIEKSRRYAASSAPNNIIHATKTMPRITNASQNKHRQSRNIQENKFRIVSAHFIGVFFSNKPYGSNYSNKQQLGKQHQKN